MDATNINAFNPALDLFLIELAGRYSILRRYAAGQTVFAEGETGRTMLLILSGLVKISKRSPLDDRPLTIATRGAGDFLGEMALVEESTRFATATAQTNCEVLEFSKENFEQVIREAPALATSVLRSLSTKLRESDSQRVAELEESNQLLTASNKELMRLNSFLDCVIDQSPSAILLTTRLGRIYRMNKAAANMFGLSDNTDDVSVENLFKGLDFGQLYHSSVNTWHGEAAGVRGTEQFAAYLSVTSLSGHNNSLLYMIICQDISELHLFNKSMIELEKYSSAQETAAELAHDLKNYLGVLVGNVELLVARLSQTQKEQSERTIRAINRSTQEIVQFLENMMVYREDKAGFCPVDVKAMVRAVVRFCQSQVRFQTIKLDLSVAENFPTTLMVKEGQFQSVLVNLLINAADALSDPSMHTSARIMVDLEVSSDTAAAIIRVADNGPGIPPELQGKLFKERLTTKSDGHGIGLVSVNKIIKNHGGEIVVSSDTGQGATFEIRLPLEKGLNDA